MNPNSIGYESHKADNDKVAEMLEETSMQEGMVAMSEGPDSERKVYRDDNGNPTIPMNKQEHAQWLDQKGN